MNKWTVHVTDFGKIKNAEVQVAPLTFFVGDNNSGKSYLMTLIYGLLNIQFYLSDYEFDEESENYRECCRILDSILRESLADKEGHYNMSETEKNFFQQLINEVLNRNKEKFLLELFNREIAIEELWLEFDEHQEYQFDVDVFYDSEDREEKTILHGFNSDGYDLMGYGGALDKIGEKDRYMFLVSYIMECMLKKDFECRGGEKTVYFPTARTGFLLTYKTLVGSAMRDKFNLKETEKNLLTRPNSDFLTCLSGISVQKQRLFYQKLVTFIENHLICGHISVSDMPTQDILYMPAGEDKQLPMYVTSGVVTELTPLLLFLNYVNVGTALIEEPEISLHPALQREMARVLVRMNNEGIPVFVTTHSDIIIQHINNMIKLAECQNKGAMMKRLGYDEDDLLNRQQVAVYQFDVAEDQRTIVTKLPCGDYGFEAMTFYDTLKNMNEEI